MTIAATLMLLAMAPPVPPPEPELWAAAVRVWEKAPPSEQEKQVAMTEALRDLARETLTFGHVLPGDRGWLEKREALARIYSARLPADRTSLDKDALACVAQGLGWSFTLDELRQIESFVGTEAGARFWSGMRGRPEALSGCYRERLHDLILTRDEDLKALGIKPRVSRYPPQPFVD